MSQDRTIRYEIPNSDDIVFSDESKARDEDQDGFSHSEEFDAESADSSRISARKRRWLSVDGGGAVAPAQDRLSRSQNGLNRDHGTAVAGVLVSENEISAETIVRTGGGILGVDAEAKPAAIERVSRRELISEGKTRGGESLSEERKKLVGQLSDKLETLEQKKVGHQHGVAASGTESEDAGSGGGSLHSVDPFADASINSTRDEAVQSVSRKLSEIVIPEINFEDTTITEALDFLSKEAAKHDPTVLKGLGGVNLSTREFKYAEDFDSLGSLGSLGEVKIDSLNITNVPLGVALQYVAEKARLRYKIGEDGVEFMPISSDESEDVVTRRFEVGGGFESLLEGSGGGGGDDPFASEDDNKGLLKKRQTVKQLLEQQGVRFSEGASANLLDGTLIVRNSPTQLELIEAITHSARVEQVKLKEEEAREKVVKKAQQELGNNFETLVSEKSDSTFSLNVSDVSFKLAKSALGEGRWPDASKVRPEEFVNAFDYGDTKPNQAEKISCVIEQGSHPFMQQRSLMRVALSTAALGRNASTSLRLTILLDQSGSMDRNDRAESVRRAFNLLAAQLTAADEVTLVGFARTPRLLAERVKGDQCAKLSQIVNNTPTEGGTNLEEALTVGLQLAKQQFLENAQNRIILLTDGAANLGDALPETLSKEVEKMRRAGVAFDACGVGADGFNDDILSALTKQGDGRYYFLDRPEDADEGFARQIAGALRPSAKNVKVQVIFNPDRVERFKLYGFEKHKLNKEDFRNDSVDAAEMAAEESGVAMYHYQAMPQGRGDVGTVSVRFQDVASGKMIERTWNIPYEPSMANFSQATPSLQLAGSAALFGEKLKGSVVGERVDLGELRRAVSGVRGTFGGQRRFEELRTMLEQASR